MKLSRYPLLNDGDWLRQTYEGGKSLEQIAGIVGATNHGVVRKSLIRFGIPIRSKGDGQRLRYNKTDNFVLNLPVIEGCLLGDGYFKSENKISGDSAPVFGKRNIFRDHVDFVAAKIFGTESGQRVKLRTNNGKQIYELSTLSHPELLPLYRKWYPPENGYRKVIPPDITLTPDTLLHWFLDDGYSYMVQKGPYRYIRIEFACQSFLPEELRILAEHIKAQFGLVIYPRLHKRNGAVRGTGMEMHLSQSSARDFFKIIGPPPVVSLAYKWKV